MQWPTTGIIAKVNIGDKFTFLQYSSWRVTKIASLEVTITALAPQDARCAIVGLASYS